MKTIPEALDFLESQPDIEKYLESRGMLTLDRYHRCTSCPIAQYLTAEVGRLCWVGCVSAGPEIDLEYQELHESYDLPQKVLNFRRSFDDSHP